MLRKDDKPDTTQSSSYLSMFYTFFSSSPTVEEHEKNENKKNHRSRYAFSSNITASLALPDIIIKTPKKHCPSTPSDNSNHAIFTSLFNSISSYLFNSTPVAVQTDQSNDDSTVEFGIHKKIKLLQARLSKQNDEDTCDKIVLEQVTLLKSQIQEHASRRVDLFFYLLLAVYKKYVHIEKAETVKQHGKGSKTLGTQACHSSLFPNVTFQSLPSSWIWFWSSTICPSLSNTQLEEALNMTVELPGIVNNFDGHLEGRSRPTKYTLACLDILNKAAKNTIDPLQGMNEFFQVMNDFFTHFEKKHMTSKKEIANQAIKKVWKYEKLGTFNGANINTLTIRDDYLHLILRLNTSEINNLKRNPRLLASFYTRIQDEIYTSLPHKEQTKKRTQKK